MQKLWHKTKKSFTVGVNKMDEKISKKTVNEPPEYVKAHDKLKFNEDAINNLLKSINSTSNTFKKMGSDVKETTCVLEKTFEKNGVCENENAVKSKNVADELAIVTTRLSDNYIPTQILAPLTLLNDKVKAAKVLKEKRRKNRILLQQEEAKLKDARSKDKDVDHYEEKFNTRKAKYDKYDADFIAAVKDLNKERKVIFVKVYNAYQYYLMELCQITEKKFHETLGTFPFDDCKNEFPSLNDDPINTMKTNLETPLSDSD